MNKLTAEKCREMIDIFKSLEKEDHLALASEYHLQAYEKALPVLEQQESQCQKCAGTGLADSGGTQPWGEPILIECDCQFEQQEQSDGWIEWNGGDNPAVGKYVQVRFRDGMVDDEQPSASYRWYHDPNDCDIISYRVIEQQEKAPCKHQEGE